MLGPSICNFEIKCKIFRCTICLEPRKRRLWKVCSTPAKVRLYAGQTENHVLPHPQYVWLLSVTQDKSFRARVEIDVGGKTGPVARKALTIKQGDDLFLLSGHRDLYEGYTVAEIDCTSGFEHVEFGNFIGNEAQGPRYQSIRRLI